MDQNERHAIEAVTSDLARLRIAFANVFLAGEPGMEWTLVDAGLSVGAAQILEVAAERYGQNSRPAAIVLTHGHFDHIGGIDPLLAVWDVPVYAHPLEMPYLTGHADYPPPDPTVGRGLMARMSPLFPEKGINLGDRIRPLPENGDVPGMAGWRWIHTPGHSPGHISLFRDNDRILVAGDAISTTRPESVFASLTQREELCGPPAYFTIDWDKARRSVETLALLKPATIASGHGPTLEGEHLPAELAKLAHDFDHRVRPRRGRYVHQPAVTDEQGVLVLPPPIRSAGVRWGMLSGVAATAFAGTWLVRRFSRTREAHQP